MSNIPFKITSLSTGEWHIVVSDTSGVVDTSSKHYPHSNNTNINDSLFDETTGQITDESSLIAESGCWFGLNNKTDVFSEANDERGAIPYGTYIIEELLVSKNQPYYPFGTRSFVISNSDYNIAGGN
ncbi:MAG: hypothetical protein Q4F54_00980 [Coriobacteriia bacterium]|nr:hypothetical protein [Coriobacteriia bacterium]